jgi:maltose/maltodextrin transport system substrate-binding protein/arabinogalactan oligomer/maltooligosaccharide transport system substrate-binding protein
MKKRNVLLTLLVVIGIVLSACQPAATPAPTAVPATEAPPPTAVPPTEAPEPTEVPPTEEPEVGLVIWADNTRTPILVEAGARFQEEFGVAVEVQEVGFGDIRDNFQVAGPAGEGPDILIGAHDWLGQLVASGLLAPVDLGDKADQFFGPAVDAFTYEGVLYGMPYATENVAFFRNTDLVPDAPATWDEVESIAADLESSGDVQQGYSLMTNDAYHFFPIQTAFGGYVFGRDAEGNYNPEDLGIDSEGTLAAAAWLERMTTEGHLNGDTDWDTMHALFEQGQAAMIITGPWALPRIRESGVPYAISPIPGETEESKPFLGVQGFMVSAFSKDPLLAQAFLSEFVATDEVMQAMFEADPRPSAYLPVREAIDDADLAAFSEAGALGLPMPAIPEMSAVWSAWGNAITLVMQGAEGGESAFTTAAEQIRETIAGQ